MYRSLRVYSVNSFDLLPAEVNNIILQISDCIKFLSYYIYTCEVRRVLPLSLLFISLCRLPWFKVDTQMDRKGYEKAEEMRGRCK